MLFVAGCGGKLYEERLANTGVLLAHIGHLNDHLQAKWTDPETGVNASPSNLRCSRLPSNRTRKRKTKTSRPVKPASNPRKNPKFKTTGSRSTSMYLS